MIVKHYIPLAILACALAGTAQTNAFQKSHLVKCWADSREDNIQGSGINIYRPCDFKEFPASRFRFRMELNDNGSCSYLHLASNDAHYMAPGSWTYNEQNNHLEIWDQKGNLIRKFKVLDLQKDLMETAKD